MSSSLRLRLFCAIALAVVGAAALEWAKPVLFPGLSTWQSIFLSLIWVAGITAAAVFAVFKIFDRRRQQIAQEIARRKRLEIELSQLNQKFEERIRDQTSELARLNVELDFEIVQHKQAEEAARASEERFRNMAEMLEQAVDERTHELSTVLEVSKNITSTIEIEPLLDVLLDQIKTIIPYSGAAIFTLRNQQLAVVAYHVPNLPKNVYPLHLTLANAGACQEVIQGQSVMIVDDVNGDSPLARAFQETGELTAKTSFAYARSWIGIPLVIKEHVIGLLSLTHDQPNYYVQRHARLAWTIANQVAVAMENAMLYEQAHDLATLEERQRIARELHDSVTQLLYGICLYSTMASRSLRENEPERLAQQLSEIKEDALQALQEMRLLIYELQPPALLDEGLAVALHASLDAIKARTGLQTEFQVEGIDRLPGAIEGELFRIAMEALNNLVKYSGAKQVSVDLRTVDEMVTLEIRDNGVGFDLSAGRESGGFGLRNMERRAKRIGGTLEITSVPGSGTRVVVAVRVRRSAQVQEHPSVPSEITENVEA